MNEDSQAVDAQSNQGECRQKQHLCYGNTWSLVTENWVSYLNYVVLYWHVLR